MILSYREMSKADLILSWLFFVDLSVLAHQIIVSTEYLVLSTQYLFDTFIYRKL